MGARLAAGEGSGRRAVSLLGVGGSSLALGDAGKGVWAWGVDVCSGELGWVVVVVRRTTSEDSSAGWK